MPVASRRLEARLDGLRAEVRAWLAAHGHEAHGIARFGAYPPNDHEPTDAERRWAACVRAGGWSVLSWPACVGGRELSPVEVAVVTEEFALAGAPLPEATIGERLVAPTLLACGTPAQQAQWLPGIRAGTQGWCQGFSEPGAGSDLASVSTRGVIEGDEVVVTGQKVWTTHAHRAVMMLLLCRTDPSAERHTGLTAVLLPMDQPGVVVRPLRQLSGASGFNEVFLDGARAPLANVVGGVGNGWRVAQATLGSERGGEVTVAHLGHQHDVDALIAEARRRGRAGDPVLRQRLADAYTRVQLLKWNGMRSFARLRAGQAPGPESSVHKLLSSESHRRLGELATDVMGPDAMVRPDGEGYPIDDWQRIFLESRGKTISRGTNEIQRTIVAERVLGLPRPPRGG